MRDLSLSHPAGALEVPLAAVIPADRRESRNPFGNRRGVVGASSTLRFRNGEGRLAAEEEYFPSLSRRSMSDCFFLSVDTGMKGYSADDRHHEALRRIVTVLLALAGLAEQAACRSWPVRRIVLWLLRPAERAARSFAAEVGCVALPLFPVERPAPDTDDDPRGAARLARQFRALAAAFSALIHRAPVSHRLARRPCPGRRRRPNAAWLDRLLLAFRPRCADTS